MTKSRISLSSSSSITKNLPSISSSLLEIKPPVRLFEYVEEIQNLLDKEITDKYQLLALFRELLSKLRVCQLKVAECNVMGLPEIIHLHDKFKIIDEKLSAYYGEKDKITARLLVNHINKLCTLSHTLVLDLFTLRQEKANSAFFSMFSLKPLVLEPDSYLAKPPTKTATVVY